MVRTWWKKLVHIIVTKKQTEMGKPRKRIHCFRSCTSDPSLPTRSHFDVRLLEDI